MMNIILIIQDKIYDRLCSKEQLFNRENGVKFAQIEDASVGVLTRSRLTVVAPQEILNRLVRRIGHLWFRKDALIKTDVLFVFFYTDKAAIENSIPYARCRVTRYGIALVANGAWRGKKLRRSTHTIQFGLVSGLNNHDNP
jgi:hypothetical protein